MVKLTIPEIKTLLKTVEHCSNLGKAALFNLLNAVEGGYYSDEGIRQETEKAIRPQSLNDVLTQLQEKLKLIVEKEESKPDDERSQNYLNYKTALVALDAAKGYQRLRYSDLGKLLSAVDQCGDARLSRPLSILLDAFVSGYYSDDSRMDQRNGEKSKPKSLLEVIAGLYDAIKADSWKFDVLKTGPEVAE